MAACRTCVQPVGVGPNIARKSGEHPLKVYSREHHIQMVIFQWCFFGIYTDSMGCENVIIVGIHQDTSFSYGI